MLSATESELQFHMYRLGSRRRVAALYGVRRSTVAAALPVTDVDRFMSGRMVSIGGILAKRCNLCGTARELESYWADGDRASGCGAWCKSCRTKRSKR
jgi:hypothetical protein